MTEFLERLKQMSAPRLTLLALELQSKLDAALAARQEPIAIVGMACRLPGDVETPEAYWDLLRTGRDAICEVPKDRWDNDDFFDPDPDAPGRVATRFGGFLSNIDRFDAGLFGISPREALSMDPQQRLLLEVAWEALENGGQAPDALGGSATGVFVGSCNSDYYQHLGRQGLAAVDLYRASGNASSVISGRLSYVLGFQGPAVSVDTACSSSLVAVHLACQSLWAGESRMVLAGGVNVICSPETTVALSRSRMMAPDGRCKAFDSRADGFVRGEGCGLVVLKRLSDAQAAGDRVLALIRGTAANQDGRSSGLTAPNGPSQEAVIRAALAHAGIEPADVDYVESHGTGTSLGDPIEARALGAVLRPGRDPGRPAIVGSVKTNFGHLESAAGIAGLMKVVLSLQHEAIPPHLHLKELNPHVDWSSLPLRIPSEGASWPRSARRRIAGVSSFGFSGTNAHVVLEEAPLVPEVSPGERERPLHLVTVSGKTESSLRGGAARLSEHLARHPEASLSNVAHTANVGRAHLVERAAVLAGTVDEARARLAAMATASETPPGVLRGRAGTEAPRIAFLFTGQGAQAVGMGRRLYETHPAFRASLDRCAEVARGRLDRPLLDLMFGGVTTEGLLDRTRYTQPCLFAIEWSLAELWRSWGIEPAAVLGHSLGELSAACVAGVFSLEDALGLVIERANLMDALPSVGGMAAVFAEEARVQEAIARHPGKLWIAAHNAPDNVVVSGDGAALSAVIAGFEARGVKAKRLVISNAFHSPLVEPMLDALERAAERVEHHDPRVDLVSNLTGEVVRPGELGPRYWRRHVRDAVRFAPSLRTLADQGYRIFVEIGPHPTLLNLAQGSLGPDMTYLPSLRRGADDWQTILDSLGALYVRGARVDWSGFDKPYARKKVGLPTYAFQRERYWIEAPPPGDAPAPVVAGTPTGHPALGRRLSSAVPTFESRVGPAALPLLGEHRVFGVPLAAAPVLVDLFQAAAAAVDVTDVQVEDLVLREPLVFPGDGDRVLQVVLVPADDEGWLARAYSRAPEEADPHSWVMHASARVRLGAGWERERVDLDAVRGRCAEEKPAAFYEALGRRGIELGPAFRGLERLWRGTREALGRVTTPASGRLPGFLVDPGTLDACLQVIGAAAPGDWSQADEQTTYLFGGFERAFLPGPLPESLWSFARLDPPGPDGAMRGEVVLSDDAGRAVGKLSGVVLRRARREALRAAVQGGTREWFHALRWPAKALAGQHVSGPSADGLPEPETLAERVRPELLALARDHGIASYDVAVPALDGLAGLYVRRALAGLGFDPRPGERVDPGPLAARLGIVPAHLRLFERLVATLAADGLFAVRGNAYEVVAPLALADPEPERLALLARFPECAPEIGLLARCGQRLAEVLRGTADPLALLFPEGSFAAVESLYQDSPVARAYNGALARVVAAAVEALPAPRPVRVLELGAGTGGSSSYVLPLLPRDRTRYLYTDLSRLFLARAADKFREHSFIEYALVDAERPFPEQGVSAHAFDLVVASNALHATRDLAATLRNVREALAPGGLLILLEGTRGHLWVDVTFGLTDGWWRFADTALRPAYPLLDAARWRTLLREVGFKASASVHGDADGDGLGRQSILIAREPLVAPATPVPPPIAIDGPMLVFGNGRGLGEALATLARAAGGTVLHEASLTAATAGAAVQAARAQAPEGELRVLNLSALDAPVFEAGPTDELLAYQVQAASAFAAVLSAVVEVGGKARIDLVTRGAQSVPDSEGAAAPMQAPSWGLGRVAALEHPGLFGRLIDLDPAGSAGEARMLLDEVLLTDGEDQIAFRGGTRHVARLQGVPPPGPATLRLRPDGIHLVTGGLGGLGLSLARWLAGQGVRDLVLTSRRGLPPRDEWASLSPESDAARQASAVGEIEARGVRVEVAAVDVGDEAAMSSLMARLSARGPLRTVFHLAADMSSRPIVELEGVALGSMLRPKIAGALNLHRLTSNSDLDAFVLFSSTTALLGVVGLGHYAAANQFLDALARYRRAHGLPALSVNWGTWETMRVASEAEQRQFLEAGLLPLPTDAAFDALRRLAANETAGAVVAHVEWQTLKGLYESRRPRPLLADLGTVAVQTVASAVSKGGEPDLVRRFREAPVSKRRDVVLDAVRGEVARILGMDPRQPMDSTQGLFEMGMDSLMSVELKSRLQVSVGRSLPSTLTFNHPNIGALTEYLMHEVLPASEVPSEGGEAVGGQEGSEQKVLAAARIQGVDAAVDDLSVAEVDRLLEVMMRKRPE